MFIIFVSALNILVIILFYLIIFLLINKWRFFRNSGISSKKLHLIFAIKFGVGLFLTWIYSKHYPIRSEADIFKYFDDSEILFSALKEHPSDFFKMLFGIGNDNQYFFDNYYIEMNNWDRQFDSHLYNDSHTIIRINAVIRIISFGVFHVHTLFFCFFSMIGLTAIHRVIKKHFKEKGNALLICLFLLPSVLFWSSGVLKEAILLMGMGLLLFSLDKIIYLKRNIFYLLLLLCTLLVLLYIKFYVLIVLSPVLLAWIINQYWSIKKKYITYIFIITLGSITLFNIEKITPQYDFKEILVRKQQDFKGLANHMNSGSQFELTDIEQNFLSIIKVTPEAITNCFIRPLPSKSTGIIQWFAITENLFILLMLFFAAVGLIKNKSIPVESSNLFLFGIALTLLLFTIIGLTTPVAGALVRYKVPALPFLTASLLLLIDLNPIIKRIPFLKILR